MRRTKTIRGLKSIQALTHPLRQQILGILIDEALTVRELADRIGIAVHPLYHHVRVLTEAQMIRVVEKRKIRGALERRYRATATCFSVSPAAVLSGSDRRRAGSRLAEIAGELAAGAVSEIRRQGPLIAADARAGRAPLISQVRVSGSSEEISALRDQIESLLDQFQSQGCGPAEAEYEMTLFFYPRKET